MAESSLSREQIRDVVARYNIAGDRRDLDAFVAAFCEDAIWESAVFRCVGRSAIRDYLSVAWQPSPGVPAPRFRRHHLTTTQMDEFITLRHDHRRVPDHRRGVVTGSTA